MQRRLAALSGEAAAEEEPHRSVGQAAVEGRAVLGSGRSRGNIVDTIDGEETLRSNGCAPVNNAIKGKLIEHHTTPLQSPLSVSLSRSLCDRPSSDEDEQRPPIVVTTIDIGYIS